MSKIIQLSPHIANLIAAGEVVERPASVVKELLENAVDAGATHVTVEIRDGGMTFLRVTDNGCGMSPEDARTAFLRHATSKLRTAEDLAAITTMGFRGEALAAIASVSRIDLMTKPAEADMGYSVTLEAGAITDQTEAGCPDGTTIIVRDLFFNTPARMKFMKSDTVEGSKVTSAVQQQALAHPEVAFRFLRDGKEVLSTPGTGKLDAAAYCIYGRESGRMVAVDSRWEGYHLTGFVCKPTDARPSRNMQTFFVNDRPVKSRLLIAGLEEAYRNQIMVGKFPACVLHLRLPASTVDVNVHPAKTEVKFLNEKAVFDCVHYGVLAALNGTKDRPAVQFREAPKPQITPLQSKPEVQPAVTAKPKPETTFRTMTAQEYKNFTAAIQTAPKPNPAAAVATVAAVEKTATTTLRATPPPVLPFETPEIPKAAVPVPEKPPVVQAFPPMPEETLPEEPQQQELDMPVEATYRIAGELFDSYILVEQEDEALLIDKHAAHERILFNKLKANQETISSQALIKPLTCSLNPEECGILLDNRQLLTGLGFEISEFGENTILIRQVPMDLDADSAPDTLTALASDLLKGKAGDPQAVRDEILHTVACKAAIKAGWHSSEKELEVLVRQVMEDDSLKHCPHGRPICVTLTKKQLEKQFKRS